MEAQCAFSSNIPVSAHVSGRQHVTEATYAGLRVASDCRSSGGQTAPLVALSARLGEQVLDPKSKGGRKPLPLLPERSPKATSVPGCRPNGLTQAAGLVE